jgi:Ca2+-binding RTX toxin-like protein
LQGDDGDDKLSGMNGDDVLVGGSGADSFDCGLGRDTVGDFNQLEGDVALSNCEVFDEEGWCVHSGKAVESEILWLFSEISLSNLQLGLKKLYTF